MIGNQPGLSVLIPWYQRDELPLTLAANAPFFLAQAAEVLVLNCGGDGGRLRELIIASEVAGVRQLDISAPGFNKSLALNIGLSHCQADMVLTLDTDIVLLDDALPAAMASRDHPAFVTAEWLIESLPPASTGNPFAVGGCVAASLVKITTLALTFPDGTTIHYEVSRQDALGGTRPGTGLLLAKKHDLLEMQGYNSEIQTWGWEDDDVLVRLQYERGLRRIQRGAALHLSHGDERRAPQLGGRSDYLNFLKCCRNYSNGLFLGTYCSNVAWAADKVTETIPDAAGQANRVLASSGEAVLSGPADCGNGAPSPRRKTGDLHRYIPTIDELLVEASLAQSSLEKRDVLHVGIGNSRLASRLSSSCRHITGVTTDEREQAWATGLSLLNYRPVSYDPYSEGFRAQLPLQAYDIVVDCNFASDGCCQLHWKRLMENYSGLLGPSGWLLTSRAGTNASPTGRWAPGEDDLCYLANQFGLSVSKTGHGVYTLRKQAAP